MLSNADVLDQDQFVVLLGEELREVDGGVLVEALENLGVHPRATRSGVSTRPSRSGSSPTAIRISRTARRIRRGRRRPVTFVEFDDPSDIGSTSPRPGTDGRPAS